MNQAARNLLQQLCNVHICAHCNKIQTVADPLVCSCCTTTVYCGQSCQQRDWIAHQRLVGLETDGTKKRENSDDENRDKNTAPTKKVKESKEPELSLSLLEKLPIDVLRLLTGLGGENVIRNISGMSRKLNLAGLDVAKRQLWWTFPATKAEFETVLANMKKKLETVEFYNVKLRKPADAVWLRENGLWSKIRALDVDYDDSDFYDDDDYDFKIHPFKLQGLDNCTVLKLNTNIRALDFSAVPRLLTLEIGAEFQQPININPLAELKVFKFLAEHYPWRVDVSNNSKLETIGGATSTFFGIESLTSLSTLICSSEFNNRLDVSRLVNVRHLEFEDMLYNQPLDLTPLVNLETLIGCGNITGLQSAVKLKTLWLGNAPGVVNINDYLPYLTSLTSLAFGDDYDYPVRVGSLVRLQELHFGFAFDSEITGFENLTVLKRLTFGTTYTRPIVNLHRLISLETLKVGNLFEEPLDGLERLTALTELRLGRKFDATGLELPPNLQLLECFREQVKILRAKYEKSRPNLKIVEKGLPYAY